MSVGNGSWPKRTGRKLRNVPNPRSVEIRAERGRKGEERSPPSSLPPQTLPPLRIHLNPSTLQKWMSRGVFSTFTVVSCNANSFPASALFPNVDSLGILFVGGYYFGSVDQERYSIQRFARKINGRVLGESCAFHQDLHSGLYCNYHDTTRLSCLPSPRFDLSKRVP